MKPNPTTLGEPETEEGYCSGCGDVVMLYWDNVEGVWRSNCCPSFVSHTSGDGPEDLGGE